MMQPERDKAPGIAAVVIVLAAALALGACATGTMLKVNEADSAALLDSDAGRQKFNTIRIQTYGPVAEQAFGYFLYRDGIEVVTGGGAHVVNMGKLTLVEVMADYDGVRKSEMYSTGSGLIVREILKGSSVAGYTAADESIDVGIWDITPAGKENGIVLQMVYDDTRGQHDGGSYRGRSHSGD
jgi:hypothetical protein